MVKEMSNIMPMHLKMIRDKVFYSASSPNSSGMSHFLNQSNGSNFVDDYKERQLHFPNDT